MALLANILAVVENREIITVGKTKVLLNKDETLKSLKKQVKEPSRRRIILQQLK
jgi:hypothetical protein